MMLCVPIRSSLLYRLDGTDKTVPYTVEHTIRSVSQMVYAVIEKHICSKH